MRLNKKISLLLIIIAIITIIPRGLEIFSSSNYFGSEQGVEYLATKSIVIDHKIILTAHQGGFGGFFKPAGFNYLIAIPFILAKGDPFGGRIFMFAISVLTVLFAFIFTKHMFNAKTAISVVFFLAISSNLSHYAGRISPPFVIPILTVFFIYSIFKICKKNHKFILLTAFILGLMMNFEIATSVVLFIEFFIILCIFCLKKIIPYRYLFFCIVILVFFISPLLIYDVNHNSHNLNGIAKMLGSALNHAQNIFLNWSQIITNRFSVFSWNYFSSITPQKLISVPIFFLMYLGAFFYIKDKKIFIEHRLLMLFIIISPILTFIMLLFYPGDIMQWWIIQLSIFYCYLIGIIVTYFWYRRIIFKILIFFFISTLFLAFISRTYTLYKQDFLFPPSAYIIENEPINYIYKDAKGKPFSILIYASRALQNYEYLLWWYGTKYQNAPVKKSKKGTLYELIENSQDIQKKLDLLESLDNGTMVETKKLKYGFIVRKKIL